MAAKQITQDVFFVGAVDYKRRLFDELIPLPDGTSYNSYLVKGSDKTALIGRCSFGEFIGIGYRKN